MTAICGYQEDGKVWIGADSAASNGWHRGATHTWKLVKLSVPSNDGSRPLVIGYTTSFRFGQILAHHLTPPIDHEEGAERYLVRSLVPEIRAVLSTHGWLHKSNERETGGNALIAYRGELHELQDDNSVLRWLDPWAACGSGYEYALGAMATAQGDGGGIVRAGLSAAALFAPGVMEPFHVEEVGE